MPLYIQNEGEIRAEGDDNPFPANTPSTGSMASSRVNECGTRVLELIEKHRREVQARMNSRQKSFKGLLDLDEKTGLYHPNQSQLSFSTVSSIPSTRNSRETSKTRCCCNPIQRSFVNAYLNATRQTEDVNADDQAEPNLSVPAYSEEYFDVPSSNSVKVLYQDDGRANSSRTPPMNTDSSLRKRSSGHRSDSQTTSKTNLKSSSSRATVNNGRVSPSSSNHESRSKKKTRGSRSRSQTGQECRFDPDEFSDSDEDCGCKVDGVQESPSNNNRVTFNTKVSYNLLDPNQRPNKPKEQNEDSTSDEDAIEGTNEGLITDENSNIVDPPSNGNILAEDENLIAEEFNVLNFIYHAVTFVRGITYRDVIDFLGPKFWFFAIVFLILSLIAGIIISVLDHTRTISPPVLAPLKPKLDRYHGPVM